MGVISAYIVNKAGGLIFSHDQPSSSADVEATFTYPLSIVLEEVDRNLVVKFGEKHGIQVGYSLIAINGQTVTKKCLPDGRTAIEVLKTPSSYPLALKFTRLKASINERIMLLSMFHSIYAISVKLSPEPKSSGIRILEASNFRLCCFQTLTGIKFIIIADTKQQKVDELLGKIYELYSDYVLKNPFYSLDMPIRCELFSSSLSKLMEAADKDRGIGQLSGATST